MNGGFPAVFSGGVVEIESIGTGLELQWAGSGHDLEIAEVSVAADAAHVSEAEAFDGFGVEAVAGAVVAAGDGVGGELDHAEGESSAGEGFSAAEVSAFALCADEGGDLVDGVGMRAMAAERRNITRRK